MRRKGFYGGLEAFDGGQKGSDMRLEGFDERLKVFDLRLEGFDMRLEAFDGGRDVSDMRLTAFDTVDFVRAAVAKSSRFFEPPPAFTLPRVDLVHTHK